MAAGINQLAAWRDDFKYGNEDMLKAYAQGVKGKGWGAFALNSNKEFIDIKIQFDNLLEKN